MANNQIFEKDKGEIILRLSPQNIERAIYIIIILVLAYFAFFGKIGCGAADIELSESDVVDTSSETSVAGEEENLSASVEEEAPVEEEPAVAEPNKAPAADFSFSPAAPYEDKDVTFSDDSSDEDGDSMTYVWKFGDGKISSEKNPVHKYASPGKYNISLTVSDGELEDTEIKVITIKERQLDGEVHLTVDDITSETGEYESSGIEWGKITKVTFTIDNQKEDFMPGIEVYTYNMASSTLMKNRVRGEVIYSTHELGSKRQHSLEIESQPFSDDDIDKVVFVKVVLIDKSTDDVITYIEEEYNFP